MWDIVIRRILKEFFHFEAMKSDVYNSFSYMKNWFARNDDLRVDILPGI